MNVQVALYGAKPRVYQDSSYRIGPQGSLTVNLKGGGVLAYFPPHSYLYVEMVHDEPEPTEPA